jgi:hypothetical protein
MIYLMAPVGYEDTFLYGYILPYRVLLLPFLLGVLNTLYYQLSNCFVLRNKRLDCFLLL